MNYPYESAAPTSAPHQAAGQVTAFTAAILATITGLLAAALTIFSIVAVVDIANDEPHTETFDFPDYGPVIAGLFVVIGIASSFLALLHLLGAVLLFMGKTAGRVVVIIASTLALTIAVFAIAGDVNPGTVAAVATSGATLVLAALPSTGGWIAARKHFTQWNGGVYGSPPTGQW